MIQIVKTYNLTPSLPILIATNENSVFKFRANEFSVFLSDGLALTKVYSSYLPLNTRQHFQIIMTIFIASFFSIFFLTELFS
jgi:hypothetical protein